MTASWKDLRASAPELAERAWTLLSRTGAGEGLLSTVNGDDLPRTHPVNVGIVHGRLLTFVQTASAKTRDLTEDGRYALHAHQDPVAPHELLVRGRATIVTDPDLRTAAVAVWPFSVNEGYPLFELGVEHVLLGERGDGDTWPPVYTSWRPASVAASA
jgi:hypothetical protein